MVSSALSLADRWNINEHIVAILVLATLTGIPNMIAAIRLAKHRRGAAVVARDLIATLSICWQEFVSQLLCWAGGRPHS